MVYHSDILQSTEMIRIKLDNIFVALENEKKAWASNGYWNLNWTEQVIQNLGTLHERF